MTRHTLSVTELVGQMAGPGEVLSSESSGSLELLFRRAQATIDRHRASHPDNNDGDMDELTYELVLTIAK